MTASLLLAAILSALLLQSAAGIGIAAWLRSRPGAEPLVDLRADAGRATTAAWAGLRPFRVARRVGEDAGSAQCSFYLEPVDGVQLPPFKPGQFLTLSLEVGATSDSPTPGSAVIRCYSLSDRPTPSHYRITVKRVPGGIASEYLHAHVQPGDILQLRAPAGPFVLDPSSDIPVVLVAGGIGITPLMSMLLWSLEHDPTRAVHLFYGIRSGADHAFKDKLGKLVAEHPALHVTTVYSSPGPDDVAGRDYQHSGHIDVALLRRILPHGSYQLYVCGPPGMMASLIPALHAWGVPPGNIHHEAFGPASLLSRAPIAAGSAVEEAASFELVFRRSARTLTWDGRDETLLDCAERHGIAVPSGCRAGSCGSCETTLVSGSVTYRNPPDYDVEPGACLLCVGRPASALCLEA